jgi:hypothetical protein
MLRLIGIEVRTDTYATGVVNIGAKLAEQRLGLINEIIIKEVRVGLRIEQGDDVRVYTKKEGEGRRNIGTEDRAVMLLHPGFVELVWSLEPKIV